MFYDNKKVGYMMMKIMEYGFTNFSLNYDILKATSNDLDKTLNFLIEIGPQKNEDLDKSEIFKN